MPHRPLSFADVPTAAHAHVGDTAASHSTGCASREMPSSKQRPWSLLRALDTAIHQKKNMNQDTLSMTGNGQAKSSTPMWSWAILAVFALAIVAIIFGGLDVLPPSTRAGITDYIVAIGASELPSSSQ